MATHPVPESEPDTISTSGLAGLRSRKDQRLDMSPVGIEALRIFLQEFLAQQVERELPEVRAEIRKLLLETESGIAGLGEERPDVGHIRMFLTRLSMRFHGLVQAALDGNYYVSAFTFFDELDGFEKQRRLRADVYRLNGQFASDMRHEAQKRKLIDPHMPHNANQSELSPGSNLSSESDDGQILVSKSEIDVWVKKVYVRTRGRELPGNYNHVFLSELFHEQSSRWGQMASDHVIRLCDMAKNFVESALQHVVSEDMVRIEILHLITPRLENSRENALVELKKIMEDHLRQPITYDNYYRDNIQNARQDPLERNLQSALKGVVNEDWNRKYRISNKQPGSEKLFASLQKRGIVNIDDQACSEALAEMNAYYNEALKTFVDNVCCQVIERHILCDLPNVFSPPTARASLMKSLFELAQNQLRNAIIEKRLLHWYRSLGRVLFIYNDDANNQN